MDLTLPVKSEGTYSVSPIAPANCYPNDDSVGAVAAGVTARHSSSSSKSPQDNHPSVIVTSNKKGNRDIKKEEVVRSKVKRVKMQQVKLITAVEKYTPSIETSKRGSSTVLQTKMCNFLKPPVEMKRHKLSVELSCVLQKPKPWMYEDQTTMDDSQGRIHLKVAFENFIDDKVEQQEDEQEKKGHANRVNPGSRNYYSVVDLKIHCNEKCAGCGREMLKCHGIIYDPFVYMRLCSIVLKIQSGWMRQLYVSCLLMHTTNHLCLTLSEMRV